MGIYWWYILNLIGGIPNPLKNMINYLVGDMVMIWLWYGYYMVIIWLMMVNNNLIGGIAYLPLWKIWVSEFVSWDDDIPN
jgi:hypothetical protein